MIHLMKMGKAPKYDPARPETAIDFELKVSAIVQRAHSGYMDSPVVVKTYRIGYSVYNMENVAERPQEKP